MQYGDNSFIWISEWIRHRLFRAAYLPTVQPQEQFTDAAGGCLYLCAMGTLQLEGLCADHS
jgi:hypothetical protein